MWRKRLSPQNHNKQAIKLINRSRLSPEIREAHQNDLDA